MYICLMFPLFNRRGGEDISDSTGQEDAPQLLAVRAHSQVDEGYPNYDVNDDYLTEEHHLRFREPTTAQWPMGSGAVIRTAINHGNTVL